MRLKRSVRGIDNSYLRPRFSVSFGVAWKFSLTHPAYRQFCVDTELLNPRKHPPVPLKQPAGGGVPLVGSPTPTSMLAMSSPPSAGAPLLFVPSIPASV